MIKKIFLLLVLLFLAPRVGFAQAVPQLPAPSVPAIPVQIDEKINTGLETFLQKTLNKDYESAYVMMTDDFIKTTSLENFKVILNETQLTTFTQKTWTDFKKEMLGVLATAEGDFSSRDGAIHHLMFDIFVDAHAVKIRNISETISLQDLKKRFPLDEKLQSMLQKDLPAITDLLQKGQSRNLYQYLASNLGNSIKIIDIMRMIVVLRKSNLHIEMPQNPLIVITNTPLLTKEGFMRLQGYYHNATSIIHFSVFYDYEWQWKPWNFQLTVQPLKNGIK